MDSLDKMEIECLIIDIERSMSALESIVTSSEYLTDSQRDRLRRLAWHISHFGDVDDTRSN